jgi:hypothetical protein
MLEILRMIYDSAAIVSQPVKAADSRMMPPRGIVSLCYSKGSFTSLFYIAMMVGRFIEGRQQRLVRPL